MKPTAQARGTTPGRHVYDVIIVGGQLGGALCAALLARRGFKVLLVPHDGQGAPYLHQGFWLPHAPFVMPPAKAVEAFEEVLSELGLTVPLHRALARPALQLLRPGSWFEIRSDAKERAVELKRALGSGADAFEEAWQRAVTGANASDGFFRAKLDFPPEGMLGRWRLNRQLPRFAPLNEGSTLPQDSPLRALLPLAACVATPSPLTEARALGQLLTWPSVYPGGREGLYELFAERARELGADVVGPEDFVGQLELRGASVSSIRLGGAPTTYRAELFIGAMDLTALALLAPEGRQAAIERAGAQLAVKKQLFTFNAVLPETALPRCLGTFALVQGGASSVLFQVTPARGPDIEPEKTALRVLTAAMETSEPLRGGDEAQVRAHVDRVWKTLDAVMPFTRAKARLESTPWLNAPQVVDGRVVPSPLFEVPSDSWFGVTGHPTQSPARRLLLASRQVLPGLGFEGEVLAAVRAAQRVDRSLKRQEPLNKPTKSG